jgi:hypothetical protein
VPPSVTGPPFPATATQTIRGVSVSVEATANVTTPYNGEAGIRLAPDPRPGYRLASIVVTATNSTTDKVTVPSAPLSVSDATGTAARRLHALPMIPPGGLVPGGTVAWAAIYEYPSKAGSPLTVVWVLGGDRTYTFRLQGP